MTLLSLPPLRGYLIQFDLMDRGCDGLEGGVDLGELALDGLEAGQWRALDAADLDRLFNPETP